MDTLPTVPDAPPSAGPDRAFDPPLPDPRPLGAVPDTLLVVDGLLLELGFTVVQALIASAMASAPAVLEAMSLRESIGRVLLSFGSVESVARQVRTPDACRASPLVAVIDCG